MSNLQPSWLILAQNAPFIYCYLVLKLWLKMAQLINHFVQVCWLPEPPWLPAVACDRHTLVAEGEVGTRGEERERRSRKERGLKQGLKQ